MIVSLKGILTNKTPSNVIIDVSGIGYLCFISNNTYDALPLEGKKVSLLIYHQISENSQSLYGFSDKVEKDMFLMLISVSGIGPKTGINLLSSVSPNEFKRRLVAGEVELLSALPGIGPKTARRIIVELKEKLISYSDNSMPIENSKNSETYQDAYNALKSLGFNLNEINKCLSELTDSNKEFNTPDLIKEALKALKK